MGGMIRSQTVYSGLKLFVSALAAVLLFKLLINGSPDLYSTFFVFIADKAIDTFFSSNTYESDAYQTWGIINGIVGSIACVGALVVTFWTDDGSVICGGAVAFLQVFFGICIVSFLIRDIIQAIYYPLMRRQIVRKINISKKNK